MHRQFDDPVDLETALSAVEAAPDEYGWGKFHLQNALLEEAFSAELGWNFIDVYTPTLSRMDSHVGGKDCLHYCSPGPVDHWAILLYNILLSSEAGSR